MKYTLYNTSKMSSYGVNVKNNVLTYLQKLENAQQDIIQKLNVLKNAIDTSSGDIGLHDAITSTIVAAENKLHELAHAIAVEKQNEEEKRGTNPFDEYE